MTVLDKLRDLADDIEAGRIHDPLVALEQAASMVRDAEPTVAALEAMEERAQAMLTVGARPGETNGPAVLKRATARTILGGELAGIAGMQWGVRFDDGDLDAGDQPTFQVCVSRPQAVRRALAGGKARVVVRTAPGAWFEACARCGDPITDPERAPVDASALCWGCGDPE